MLNIRYKLLLVFCFSIVLLTLSSFYVTFFVDKISHTAINTIAIKNATEDIVLSSSNINKALILYSGADENKLQALEFEIESGLKSLENNIQIIEKENIFNDYTLKIRKTVKNFIIAKNKVISLKNEQTKEEIKLYDLSQELKINRHGLINEINKNSNDLKLSLTIVGYLEKEFLFQYQEKKYEKLWMEEISKSKTLLEKKGYISLMPIIDAYQDAAEKSIIKTYNLNELKTNKVFYLTLAEKDFFEIDLASMHISKIANENLNQIFIKINNQKQLSFIFILLSFIIGVTLAINVSHNMTKSIKELVKAAKRISNGNLGQKVKIDSKDEIGYLASSFNEMVLGIKKSKEKIKKEHEQIKSIISSMGEGLIVIDNNYKITTVNKVTEKLLKISSKKLLGKNIKEILFMQNNKKELPFNKWPIEKVFKNKKPSRININNNIYLKSISCEMFPVQMSIDPLYEKKFNGVVVVFRDITELKLIEENKEFSKHNLENVLKSVYIERDNVQEEKNKLKAILNSIGDAVLAIDQDKKIIIFNPIAERITGFKLEDIENHPYNDFLNFIEEESKKVKTDLINKALMGKAQASNNNLAMFTKKKNLILVDINASPIKNKKGRVMGCIIVFRDVTEKRETERMRSDFISTVSHQLRTPLSAMKWFIEILLNEDTGKLKLKQTEIINEIQSSNQNMINFVNQMLSVSRIENDNLAINPEIVNLNSLINKLIKELEPVAKTKNQKLKFIDLTDKSLEINIDKNLLRNIIDNLIVNALRYTPENGKIVLSIKRKGKDHLLFEVKDNGIGIPKKDQSKLFKKFSRGSNAIKYEASGTGLGLYIIKSILDLIGGKIWFRSEENKGTTFFFTLPIDSMFCKIGEKCAKK
ncbi:MAG: ATP-binding protein [Patescibacteria group bacterium]|nr:ATP-binding protein [Patescibacteria group bacterium]